jgi:hypothetical protein
VRGVKGSTPEGYDKSAAWRARNPVRALAIRKASQRHWYMNNKARALTAATEWAASNPEKRAAIIARHAPRAGETQNARKREKKLRAIAHMGGCCADCSGTFHPAAMDFHHLDESAKENNVAALLAGGWERVVAELEKCVLLCANCHRTRHAQ